MQRDRLYVVVTLAVLGVLAFSMTGEGYAGRHDSPPEVTNKRGVLIGAGAVAAGIMHRPDDVIST